MKNILTILIIILIISCKKDIVKPIVQSVNNPIHKNGSIIFYTDYYSAAPMGSGTVVFVNGDSIGVITNSTISAPSCGSFWGKTFTGADGTYSYHCKVIGYSYSWDGTFTLFQDCCLNIKLTD